MSKLRRQLDSLRQNYSAVQYTGDLAGQLLGDTAPQASPIDIHRPNPMRTASRWRLGLAWAAGALAASIGLVVLLYEPAANVVQNSVSRFSQAANLPFFEIGSPAIPTTDDHFSIIPEFRSLNVSVPLNVSADATSGSVAATLEAA